MNSNTVHCQNISCQDLFVISPLASVTDTLSLVSFMFSRVKEQERHHQNGLEWLDASDCRV